MLSHIPSLPLPLSLSVSLNEFFSSSSSLWSSVFDLLFGQIIGGRSWLRYHLAMMKICQLQSIYVIHESSSWQVTIRLACEYVFLFFFFVFNGLRTEVIGSCQWMFHSQHPFICYLCETSRVDWLALSSAHRNDDDLPTHCHRWSGEKMRSIWWQTTSCRGGVHPENEDGSFIGCIFAFPDELVIQRRRFFQPTVQF